MSYTYVNVKSCLYTAIALLTLTVVAVFSRIALRARTARKAVNIAWGKHLDDLFCLLALVPTIGVSVVLIHGMSTSKLSIASDTARQLPHIHHTNKGARRKERHRRQPQ